MNIHDVIIIKNKFSLSANQNTLLLINIHDVIIIIIRQTGRPRFRIMWQGHPDITNQVERNLKPNQTNNVECKVVILT